MIGDVDRLMFSHRGNVSEMNVGRTECMGTLVARERPFLLYFLAKKQKAYRATCAGQTRPRSEADQAETSARETSACATTEIRGKNSRLFSFFSKVWGKFDRPKGGICPAFPWDRKLSPPCPLSKIPQKRAFLQEKTKKAREEERESERERWVGGGGERGEEQKRKRQGESEQGMF